MGEGGAGGRRGPRSAEAARELHATRLAGLALESWGLRDVRLKLLRLGFRIELLESEDADRRPPRYLKDSVPWLQSNYLERRGDPALP